MSTYVFTVYSVLVVWLIVGVWRLTRRRGARVAPGTALIASMESLFDDSRRAAVEVIVEDRAAERDPEHKEGVTEA